MTPKLTKFTLIFSAIFAFTFMSLACFPPDGEHLFIVVDDENIRVHHLPPLYPSLPPSPQEDEIIFTIVEKMPEFPGGRGSLISFINENRIYPVQAQENGIQGRVVLQFVVEVDGSITNIQIIRGVSPDIDREAVRIIESMPNWMPGEQRGQKVRVRYTLPVFFRLE